MSEKTFLVPNISCGHCVNTVQSELGELAGVEAVTANSDTKEVVVRWQAPADWAAIEALLTEIDYPPAG